MTTEPGWYLDTEMANTVRYWDGSAWTEHRAPASSMPAVEPASDPGFPCPYCTKSMPADARRCPNCSGQLLYCSRCDDAVGYTTKQKFVGLVRGGMKEQKRCMNCGRVLDGPRF